MKVCAVNRQRNDHSTSRRGLPRLGTYCGHIPADGRRAFSGKPSSRLLPLDDVSSLTTTWRALNRVRPFLIPVCAAGSISRQCANRMARRSLPAVQVVRVNPDGGRECAAKFCAPRAPHLQSKPDHQLRRQAIADVSHFVQSLPKVRCSNTKQHDAKGSGRVPNFQGKLPKRRGELPHVSR